MVVIDRTGQSRHDGRQLRRVHIRHRREDQRVVAGEIVDIRQLRFVDDVIGDAGHASLVLRRHKQIVIGGRRRARGIAEAPEVVGCRGVRVDDGDLVGRRARHIGVGRDVGLVGITGGTKGDVVDVVQHVDRIGRIAHRGQGDGELDLGVIGRIGDRDVVENKGLAVSAGIERGGAVGLDVDVVFGASCKAEDLVAGGRVQVGVKPDRGIGPDRHAGRGIQIEVEKAALRLGVEAVARHIAVIDPLRGDPVGEVPVDRDGGFDGSHVLNSSLGGAQGASYWL